MLTELQDINLRPFNTFRIDAKCRLWIEYTSADDIPQMMSIINGMPFINIGAGSNMLFTDDFNGAILHSKILDLTTSFGDDGSVIVRAGSGITLDDLIHRCALSGIWGLENLSGIPGEVGASAVQNVGAYGVEACDVIETVECYDTVNREFKVFRPEQLDYAYRWSMFKKPENHNRYIITFVEYKLSTQASPRLDYGSLKNHFESTPTTPIEVRNKIIAIRDEKLPNVESIGSAGSFFKNPIVTIELFERIKEIATNNFGEDCKVPHYVVNDGIKVPAAWLIDKCGFKGMRHGNVAVWHKQPLVIVNHNGKASAGEILELEQIIIDKVESTFGIHLTPEVEHVKND